MRLRCPIVDYLPLGCHHRDIVGLSRANESNTAKSRKCKCQPITASHSTRPISAIHDRVGSGATARALDPTHEGSIAPIPIVQRGKAPGEVRPTSDLRRDKQIVRDVRNPERLRRHRADQRLGFRAESRLRGSEGPGGQTLGERFGLGWRVRF